jgi:hypothetical protein
MRQDASLIRMLHATVQFVPRGALAVEWEGRGIGRQMLLVLKGIQLPRIMGICALYQRMGNCRWFAAEMEFSSAVKQSPA